MEPPTDDLNAGLAEFKKRKYGMVVACAAGQGASTDTLKQITENVVQLDTGDSATIKAFFKWVSASISTSSKSVEETGAETGTMRKPASSSTRSEHSCVMYCFLHRDWHWSIPNIESYE